ncbi:MAG: hypothetical protein IJ881_01500 [Neisseriaceae bacterium]|nr:hypothetical protein [Neisseriaceae bacterium]MBR3425843.1 hypothetical protein [Neisseriaceae bacterium]
MKKMVISALLGMLFGGAVVFAGSNADFSHQSSNIAQAKGLPEIRKNKEKNVEDKKTNNLDEKVCNPNEVLKKNKKFYFNNSIFNIKKRTVSELEFELTYKNKKSDTPFVFKGVAKRTGCDGEYYIDDELFSFPDHDDNSKYGADDDITVYIYEDNDCYLSIGILNLNSGFIIENVKECKALKETGFNDTFIAITQYE